MKTSGKVRFGVVGVGGMGSFHAETLRDGKIHRAELVAVCDTDKERMARFGDGILQFGDSRELVRSGKLDAVLVATPHYMHTTVGVDALENGLHLLLEKPISVHKADCEKVIAAHGEPGLVFGAMFNQRTDPHYSKVKKLIDGGELGELVRVNWIVTSWFRTEAYYTSGGWRATWAGEGGGVLMNQSVHQLDLVQWLCGMPARVRGFCALGKCHDIEVEDDVTAYWEYPNGATGIFVTSTCEAPGTNRLEIAGDLAKAVVEGDMIAVTKNEVSAAAFRRDCDKEFGCPGSSPEEIPVPDIGGQHVEILQNFTDAVLDGTELIAPGREGINSVELANAILYSSLKGEMVGLPLDGAAFAGALEKLAKESRFEKKVVRKKTVDVKSSF